MKYIKLYEELEGFEETWIDDEPSLDFKFIKQNGLIYLMTEYINEYETNIYNNFKYMIYGHKIHNVVKIYYYKNDLVERIIDNKKTIKIYSLSLGDFVSCLFKNLPMDIQDKVLKSYNII